MPESKKTLLVTSKKIIEIDKSRLAMKTIANVLLPAKC